MYNNKNSAAFGRIREVYLPIDIYACSVRGGVCMDEQFIGWGDQGLTIFQEAFDWNRGERCFFASLLPK